MRSYVMGVRVGWHQCLAGFIHLQCPHDALQLGRTLRIQTASELASITPQYSPILALELSSCRGQRDASPLLLRRWTFLEPFSSCCTEIAGQKRNIVNVLPSSLDFAGSVHKSPHLSLPPISLLASPRQNRRSYLLDSAGARWIVQNLANPRLWSPALLDTLHHGTCPTSQTVTSTVHTFTPAPALPLVSGKPSRFVSAPCQPRRRHLARSNPFARRSKGTMTAPRSKVRLSLSQLHIPNSTCGSSSRAHIFRVGVFLAALGGFTGLLLPGPSRVCG